MLEKMDELLIGMKGQREWGLLIITYLFLGGSGAGLYVVSMYMNSFMGSILGLLLVVLGAILLLFDLGRPERFWRAFCKPGTSWISRGTFFITLLLVTGALQIAPSIPGLESLPWGEGTAIGLTLKVVAAVLAFLVMIYTGFVLSPSPAIPFWNSTFFPIIFLVYSLLAGVDFYLLSSPILGGGSGAELVMLERFQGYLAIACLVLIFSHISVMTTGTAAARESMRMLTRGRFALAFVGGVVIAGLLLPLALTGGLLWQARAEVALASLILAGILRLFGDYLFRYLMIRVGLYDSLM